MVQHAESHTESSNRVESEMPGWSHQRQKSHTTESNISPPSRHSASQVHTECAATRSLYDQYHVPQSQSKKISPTTRNKTGRLFSTPLFSVVPNTSPGQNNKREESRSGVYSGKRGWRCLGGWQHLLSTETLTEAIKKLLNRKCKQIQGSCRIQKHKVCSSSHTAAYNNQLCFCALTVNCLRRN